MILQLIRNYHSCLLLLRLVLSRKNLMELLRRFRVNWYIRSLICVTVYVPATVTVIDEVVAPLLHNNEPVNPEAVNTELPQLLATVTVGADGVAIGAAVPLPAALVHPFTVWVYCIGRSVGYGNGRSCSAITPQ